MEQLITARCSYLELVRPEGIQSVWQLIKPGIEKVQAHSVSGWIPEDVYSALRTGHSNLHIGHVAEQYAGFAVVTPSSTWDGTVLHFWCVYNAGKHDILSIFNNEFIQIARKIGAKKLTFWSPRIGWERRLRGYGFEPRQVEFVKEL